jgi:hypothetical protein
MTQSHLAAEAAGGMNNPEAVRAAAHPLSGTAQDYDPLLEGYRRRRASSCLAPQPMARASSTGSAAK